MLIDRFERTSRKAPNLSENRRWRMLRLSSATSDWARVYPNDFTGKEIQGMLSAFVDTVSRHTFLSLQAAELAACCDDAPILDDPDTTWSLPDSPNGNATRHLAPHTLLSAEIERAPSTHSELDDTTLEAIATQRNATSTIDISLIYENQGSTNTSSLVAPNGITRQPSSRSAGTEQTLLDSSHGDEILEDRGPALTKTELSRKRRESSDGSGSLAEDHVEGHNLLRAFAVFSEETDIAIAIELCKISWELFSHVRVSLRSRLGLRCLLNQRCDSPAIASAM